MALNAAEFQLVRELVLRRSGIVLDAGKEYLIEARLGALAKSSGAATPSALIAKMRQPGGRATETAVVEAMTTNETSFFRDVHPFDSLRKIILPDLLVKRAAERRLSIWCAASSTGQEPYTLAMLLRDAFPQLANWTISFIASDLSLEVLARASAGKYSQLEVNRGLPATYIVKYFKKNGLEWEINADIRKMIDFRQINLLEAWPMMPSLDLVFIRNVLIYFNNETKKKILGRIRALMKPDAYLFLGGAETTLNIDDNFERLQANKSGYYGIRSKQLNAA